MALKSKKTFRSKLNWKLLSVTAIFAIVILVAVLELTNTIYIFHDRKAISGTIPSTSNISSIVPTKDSNDGSKNDDSSGDIKSASNDKSDTATSGSTVALKDPQGTFVSNHTPSLSKTETLKEHSVCVTTAGANCYITFSMADIEKTLKSTVAGSDGAANWDWDISEAGLTAGSWKITATASSGGKSVSTTDTLQLVVSP